MRARAVQLLQVPAWEVAICRGAWARVTIVQFRSGVDCCAATGEEGGQRLRPQQRGRANCPPDLEPLWFVAEDAAVGAGARPPQRRGAGARHGRLDDTARVGSGAHGKPAGRERGCNGCRRSSAAAAGAWLGIPPCPPPGQASGLTLDEGRTVILHFHLLSFIAIPCVKRSGTRRHRPRLVVPTPHSSASNVVATRCAESARPRWHASSTKSSGSSVAHQPGVVPPGKPGGPRVGHFHQIAYTRSDKWAGKEAARLSWTPRVNSPGTSGSAARSARRAPAHRAGLAEGESVTKCSSPQNVLRETCECSCY